MSEDSVRYQKWKLFSAIQRLDGPMDYTEFEDQFKEDEE